MKRIVRHEKFDPATIDWDYALLELERSIQFSGVSKPIKLIGSQQRVLDRTVCLITGWGTTQTSESNRILHGAEVPIVNQDVCTNAYRHTGSITPRMICAGLDQGGKDSCQGEFDEILKWKIYHLIFGIQFLVHLGDSGGPMAVYSVFNTPILIGIVSWGYGCAKPNYPGVYSRISVAREWIYQHTGI